MRFADDIQDPGNDVGCELVVYLVYILNSIFLSTVRLSLRTFGPPTTTLRAHYRKINSSRDAAFTWYVNCSLHVVRELQFRYESPTCLPRTKASSVTAAVACSTAPNFGSIACACTITIQSGETNHIPDLVYYFKFFKCVRCEIDGLSGRYSYLQAA